MKRFIALLVLLVGVPIAASAHPSSACPEFFVAGQAPDVVDHRLSAATDELCFSKFSVVHSGVTRTPLWSATHMTAAEVRAAARTERNDDFHAESRLPKDRRAELRDYKYSGYDRGHLTENSAIADQDDEEQAFSLANVVPQNRTSNRGLWERIERAVRNLAVRDGELFVVTGPIFSASPMKVGGRVSVPQELFKAVYSPRGGWAAAYVALNAPARTWRGVSIADLERETGIDVFPGLPMAVKAAGGLLPMPEGRRRR